MTRYILYVFMRKTFEDIGNTRLISLHLTLRNFYRKQSHRGHIFCHKNFHSIFPTSCLGTLHEFLELAKFLWRSETPTPCVQAQLGVGSGTAKTDVACTILKEDMDSPPR